VSQTFHVQHMEAENASAQTAYVLGDVGNLLEPTSCVFNIGLDRLHGALQHFYTEDSPCTHEQLLVL